MAEFARVQRLAQAHGAAAFGKIHITPAKLLFHFQETHVELRIVREQDRSLCKCQELREHVFDLGSMCYFFIADLVDLFCFPGDLPVRIHKRDEDFVLDQPVFYAYSGDLYDAVPSLWVQPRGLNIEHGDGWEEGHRSGL